jgi:para-aminobenzoate synthetase component 1
MLFSRLRRLDGAIWLDSGKPRSRQGRFDILSALPQWRLETRGHETLLSTARGVRQPCSGDPFVAGDELLAEMGLVSQDFAYLPFVGGLMGYWQYDLGLAADGPCLQSPAATTMRLGWYGWGLVIDHQARRGWLIFHPRCDPKIRIRITETLQSTDKKEQIEFTITRPFRSNTTRADYLDTVRRIGDYISAGDCYQVNYAQRFSAGYRGDPWAAYRKLRQAVPSPYGAYLDWEGEALLCASPERFLKVSLGQVETKPIKGTIARGRTLAEDEENAISLMNSGKDRAENLMIVDLLRNDLGKHCVPGSIKVPKLFALESFANVHHLVSTVTGTLAPGSTPLQLLRDAFPGGSITGAPKKRAMEIIAELETAPRGLYCGSIGYMSATGRLDSNIAIRTLVASGDEIHCWGGGGIVADSVAEREYEESLQKVAVLMKTLEGA